MKKKAKKSENSERWLLTYSDLITLLVALFVVLYAMSNVSQEKYEQLSQSLSSALGSGSLTGKESVLDGSKGLLDGGSAADGLEGDNPDSGGNGTKGTSENVNNKNSSTTNDLNKDSTTADSDKISFSSQMEKKEFEKLRDKIQDIMDESDIKSSVKITTENRGLVISFSENLFFDSGDAKIKRNMNKTLSKIAKLLNSTDNHILIEGHTDNVPIHNSKYSSNWQLSSERATNVLEYLIKKYDISPSRLSAVSYGEYKPVASNETSEGRKQNRRVNIVLLYDNVAAAE